MREEKRYYVYIMASRSLNLYTGVTGDLHHRVLQHKHGEIEGFTKRYHIHRLVYYEVFKYIDKAIAREKQIKAWTRAKRVALIKSENPTWQDLAEGWGEPFKLQIPRSFSAAPRPARDDNSHRDADQGKRVDSSQASVESAGGPTRLQIPRSQEQGLKGNRHSVRVARDDNSERVEEEKDSATGGRTERGQPEHFSAAPCTSGVHK